MRPTGEQATKDCDLLATAAVHHNTVVLLTLLGRRTVSMQVRCTLCSNMLDMHVHMQLEVQVGSRTCTAQW